MIYNITVKALIAFKDRDHDDQVDDPTGTHEIAADSSEEALDIFHSTVPIACLDDFEITCEKKCDCGCQDPSFGDTCCHDDDPNVESFGG